MINNLINYFNNFNDISFHMTLNRFRFNFIKRFIVYLTLEKIYRDYATDTMFCNREMIKTALIKRMGIEYLFSNKKEFKK